RSTTRSDEGLKALPAEPTAFRYRDAYSPNASSAASSSRPLRHQPGQSSEHANTRLPATSRYTSFGMQDVLPHRRARGPNAHLVQVSKQIRGVLVDAIGPGPLQLLLAVAAGQNPDPQCPGPPGREEVPHAVAHDHRVGDVHAQPIGRGQEQVRVRL